MTENDVSWHETGHKRWPHFEMPPYDLTIRLFWLFSSKLAWTGLLSRKGYPAFCARTIGLILQMDTHILYCWQW